MKSGALFPGFDGEGPSHWSWQQRQQKLEAEDVTLGRTSPVSSCQLWQQYWAGEVKLNMALPAVQLLAALLLALPRRVASGSGLAAGVVAGLVRPARRQLHRPLEQLEAGKVAAQWRRLSPNSRRNSWSQSAHQTLWIDSTTSGQQRMTLLGGVTWRMTSFGLQAPNGLSVARTRFASALVPIENATKGSTPKPQRLRLTLAVPARSRKALAG
mmetsp:Transcript_98766/g.274870  ORF Transcript_98766/g.274870 Transcript_98766/m.274870 type:complete len:213 (+) Transcript_98766:49-687(+)